MGVRQLSQVIGTIKNMPRIDELTGIGNNSDGSAMDAQLIWADSLEAKLQGLTNATQIFWQTFVNSDGAKGFIDMLTGIVNGATKLTETFGSVGVAAGALTTIFVAFTNNPIRTALKSLSVQLLGVAKSFVSTGAAGMIGGTALDAFTFANIKAKLAVIGTTIATTALQAVLTMGLSFAIMAVVGAIASFVSSLSGSNEKLKEFNAEVSSNTKELGSQVEETEKLHSKMVELENAIANTSDVDEQLAKKKELTDVQARLAEVLPETANGFDEEGRSISTNADEIERILELKRDEIEINARKFAKQNNNLGNEIEGYKDLYVEHKKYLSALKTGQQITQKQKRISSGGHEYTEEIKINVDADKVGEVKGKLDDLTLKIKETKMVAAELERQGFTDAQISDILGFNIDLLETYDDALLQAADSEVELGESSNFAANELENITVKIGDVTANAKDAAGALDELGSNFSKFGNEIELAEKALEEFNKYGGLTIETKEKIYNSGNSKLITAVNDEATAQKELNGFIKETGRLRDEEELKIHANAAADQEGLKYIQEKNQALAEQEQKVKDVELAQANASANAKNNREAESYEPDKTAKVNAEQEKTRVTVEESNKRTIKLQEEANTKVEDVNNKATAEQQKTTDTNTQANARIQANQNETTQNQTTYNTDVGNHKTSEGKKLTDTQTTMTNINSAISTGMNGLSTHYNTNANNFANSLTNMENSARSKVSNINSILSGIKQPTINTNVPSGGLGGATRTAMPSPQGMVDEFKNNMIRAVEPVTTSLENGIKPITEKLPTTLNPSILVPQETDEDKRRQANQIGSAVGNEISEVLPRVMASRAMANIPMAMASRAVTTIDPNKIVSTVKPGSTSSKKKKKQSSSSKSSSSKGSSSSKKPEKVDIKDIEDEIDRYKALKDHLSDINHYLNMNNKYREHAKGKDKYEWHYKEIKLLERKKEAIENVQKEQKKEMAELEKKLKANGFNPANGDMSNYKARLEQLKKEVNAMADTNKAKEAAKKKYEDLKKAADRYFTISDDLQKHQEDWYDTANAIKDAQIAMEEEAASEVEKIRDRLVEALKNKYEQMREGEISDLDKEVERLQNQLDEMDKQADDKKGRLAKLEAERAKWAKDDSAYGKAKVEELNKQIEELEKEIRKDEIQQSIDDLEKEKDKVNEHYDNLLSDKNIYAEANNLLSTKSQEELLAMLTEFAPDYANIGELWGKSFADKFKEELQEAKDALDFLQGNLKPKDPPKPPSPPPKPPSGSGGSSNKPKPPTPPKKGDKVKVTNKGATVYASASTSKSSGNWGKTMQLVGRSDFKVANISGNRVALSPNGSFPATGWIDKKYIAKFSKGGLTGLWNDMNGTKGKLAELHSGETILNKDQSELFYNNSTAKAFENFVKLLPNLGNMINGVNGISDEFEQNIIIENNIVINGNDNGGKLKDKAMDFTKGMIEQMRKEGIIKRRR